MIRTYFWRQGIYSPFRYYIMKRLSPRAWHGFRYGNAGDIFCVDLLKRFFPEHDIKIAEQGPRLLCIGSLANVVSSGDVLCGIGSKSDTVPSSREVPGLILHSLRGPLTLDAFKRAGHDVTSVRYLADPGLMIKYFVQPRDPVRNRRIFIPHYRERGHVLSTIPADIDFVDIDSCPIKLANKILDAECVYTSSLHGIIFSHALGRPCVFVRPQTAEPIFKFQDHYLAMGLEMPSPLESIGDYKKHRSPSTPAVINFDFSEFSFPESRLLAQNRIMT